MEGLNDARGTGGRRGRTALRRILGPFLRPRLAVVLGGGGVLGAFEVGVIEVLARRGIVPDLLVGTSVGALNAAFWAFNPTADAGDRLLPFWLQADASTMIPDSVVPIVGRVMQRKGHLTSQSGLVRAISRALDPTALIESSRIPLAVVATDADRGTKVVLRTGPVLPAILASSAIPVLFPPVRLGERSLVDGGLVANCDVETAVDDAMTDVLAVDVMGEEHAPGDLHLWDIAEQAVAVMLRRQTDLAVRAFSGRARIAVLRPRLAARPSLFRFELTAQLHQWGRSAAEEFVARHLRGRRVRAGWCEYDTSRPGLPAAPAA